MVPIVFPLDHIGIYLSQVLYGISWLTFSFLFWRGLRRQAVEEDRIFDLTFYATIAAFVCARLGFIMTHYDRFVGKSPLLTLAIWVSPGLSWLFALIGGLATLILLTRQYKVRLGLVLDTIATVLPLPLILGEAASLIDGNEIGKVARLPWSVRFMGFAGLRHPVQLYEMIAIVIVTAIMVKIAAIAEKNQWAYGVTGVWFFVLYSIFMFVLEFVKDTHVYWGGLSANQWILIGIFAECVGVLYVRGGGREAFRPFFHTIYAKISRRNTHAT